ncbi:hypothetical protein [Streptomyces sp. R08]|uniref:Uncharacterized protein n=1 Tax=Streptomyces sp. R08 TaxID=3238624 RepID=A0AB39MHX2_9ACTN
MPLTDSYGQSVTYPTLTDKPNAQSLAEGLVNGMVPKLVMSFASATVRGATIKKPIEGMITWLKDVDRLEVFDGTSWVSFAFGTNTWKTISLASGFTSNGNSNGTPQYRVVNMFGEDTIMFRGGVNIAYTGSGTSIANGGTINSTVLPTSARPASRRTVSAACSTVKSDVSSLKLDINTDGTLTIVGTNTTDIKPPWLSLNGLLTSL